MPDQLDALVSNLNGGGQAAARADGLDLADDPDEASGVASLGFPAAAAGAGATSAISKDPGRAAGEVEGRKMAVLPPESPGLEGLASLAGSAASIALLGLPAKAVTTAVGSKL